jgi:hypothetical protein
MKKYLPTLLLLSLMVLVVLVVPATASGECSIIVQRALAQTDQVCSQTGRNQACYGYTSVEAQPRLVEDTFAFEQGDIIDLERLSSLRTASLNEATGEWGIALLRVQANLPDSLPGTNVVFLLFGNAELSQDAAAPNANPMQVTRLNTGITGVTCDSSPINGLLIQTPHDTQRVTLRINGLDISLGSTVFFESASTDTLTVTTLEGSAHITDAAINAMVLPGERVRIDPNAANPGQPLPLQPGELENLPTPLLDDPVVPPLPTQITPLPTQLPVPTLSLPLPAPTTEPERGNGGGTGNGNDGGNGNGSGGGGNGSGNGNGNDGGNGNGNGNGNGGENSGGGDGGGNGNGSDGGNGNGNGNGNGGDNNGGGNGNGGGRDSRALNLPE